MKRLYDSCNKEQAQSSSASQKKDKSMTEGLERGKEQLIEQLEHLKLEKEKIERKYSGITVGSSKANNIVFIFRS